MAGIGRSSECVQRAQCRHNGYTNRARLILVQIMPLLRISDVDVPFPSSDRKRRGRCRSNHDDLLHRPPCPRRRSGSRTCSSRCSFPAYCCSCLLDSSGTRSWLGINRCRHSGRRAHGLARASSNRHRDRMCRVGSCEPPTCDDATDDEDEHDDADAPGASAEGVPSALSGFEPGAARAIGTRQTGRKSCPEK